MREHIGNIFKEWTGGEDVRTAARAFLEKSPEGLSSGQKYHYQAMESLLVGQADYWPASSPSPRGAACIRRCCRMMVHVARTCDDPDLVGQAARVLGQAGRLRHPFFAEKEWDWQYLGTDEGKLGTKWGFTSRKHPIDRVREQRGLHLDSLLPVVNKGEMDAAVKRLLNPLAVADIEERPETYHVSIEQAISHFLAHRS